jgi:uncharacterized protein YeaO (DUF488 family)
VRLPQRASAKRVLPRPHGMASCGRQRRHRDSPIVIHIQRVYDAVHAPIGARFLVDRLWPRGVSRVSLRLDGWLKDIAPSDALRRWFSHDQTKWREFRRRYHMELDQNAAAIQGLLAAIAHGPVVLLFAATDVEHNNAVALRAYVQAQLDQS